MAQLCVHSQYGRDNADLTARLKRIEGQVRGILRMVEEDRYCVDILVQLAAVKAALSRVGAALLESHTRNCVAKALEAGEGEKAVAELVDVIHQLCR